MASKCTQAGPDDGTARSERHSIFMVASILIYRGPNSGSRPGTNYTSDQGACSSLPRLLQIGTPDRDAEISAPIAESTTALKRLESLSTCSSLAG